MSAPERQERSGPLSVKIVEVGPRDGLQNEKTTIPTATKVAYILKLVEAGLKYIEVTSFVHPKAIPQLADALEVVRALPRLPEVHFSALTPNMKGLQRALESGIREIAVFTAASDTFNRNNINMSIEESLAQFGPVTDLAVREGLFVRGYVSTAFHCPYEGRIDGRVTLNVSQRLLDMGVAEVSIGDTIGRATPEEVSDTVSLLLRDIPAGKLAMHFHDTHGRALENVQVTLNLGITIFDSSSGGLGGCPYAPGASGNLATESLVAFLSERGLDTGVDPSRLREASAIIRSLLDVSIG